MTKETAHDYLPLVQALADGNTIQINIGGHWQDTVDVDFTYPAHRYRIKPEPRRWWLVEQSFLATAYFYPDQCGQIKQGTPFIEVVEVIK